MDGGGSSPGTDLGRLEKWWNTPGIILWSVVFFGGFLLNATLLLAFVKRPGLRTISNRFVMNLTVSNLLTCAVLNPLLMLDSPMTISIPGICTVAESATAFVTTSSILSIFLIAIDQYLAVVDPLRYRTRIDKLKCGILIATVWLLSAIFSLSAGLNPNPHSLWLMCHSQTSNTTPNNNSSLNITINSTLILNITNNKLTEIEETFKFIKNPTKFINEPLITLNYGFFYSIIFGIFIYLLPFISVCWIYISIYSAAHKNSERTRRTGSRPILSSASFTDDYYPVRQDISNDDFRKIPKISSLSSIDESIETSTSQLPRRLSDHHNQPSPIQEEESSTSSIVIFTVGSQDVDVTKKTIIHNTKDNNNNNNNNTKNKIPISVLKAEFLEKNNNDNNKNNIDDYVKSRFNNNYPEQKRKSSYDLMNDELLKNNLMRLKLDKNINNNNDDNLTSDDDGIDDDDDDDDIEEEEEDDDVNLNFNIDSVDGENKLKLNNNDDQDNDNEIVKKYKNNTSKLINNNNINNNKKRCFNLSTNDDNYHRKYSTGNIDTVGLFCGTNNAPIVTITPPNQNKQELQRIPSTRSTSSYINSLKYRISNGSLFKYREETRAARVSSIVIVMILICWTPYVVVLILKNLSIKFNNIITHNIDIMAFSFFILITYISPLLFGYRSRRVKRELKKIFCFKNELSYKNNKSLMAKKVLKRRHSGNLCNNDVEQQRLNLFNCVYGKNKWPKDKVHFVQVPDTALAVETCRSSFSSGASTQISTTSTDES